MDKNNSTRIETHAKNSASRQTFISIRRKHSAKQFQFHEPV